ncbi:DNA-binding response regulator [Aliidiomarina minuta]|uniref:DNA-binding response regulator n=1 Tax=Aliidiomarina minuta TaxID=880057 RepID=A0A432W7J1_9GAMM|nr:LytTR family DNA-binding domain-containing protein [Aliidiomarina minuta]RUO26053.1 DNA-binding response regulator [Aliidiomarina minuta]
MFKTLIVDDERLARTELKRLLKAHPQCQLVAEAASASEAINILSEETIDLVFLDIQMPEVTGLELAEQIPSQIQFVFCTAYNSFALDAFSLNAVDYLLKPVAAERLTSTIQRLRPPQHSSQPAYLPDDHGLLLKFADINRIVRLHEISRFESIGNHAAVYTPYGKSFIHSSLAKIEQKLNPAHFFKASRGDIIRIDAIAHIEPTMQSGSLIAILTDKQQVDVSRRQAKALKTRFSGL